MSPKKSCGLRNTACSSASKWTLYVPCDEITARQSPRGVYDDRWLAKPRGGTAIHTHQLTASTPCRKNRDLMTTALVTRAVASKLFANAVPMLRNTKMPSGTGRLLWRRRRGQAVQNTLEDISHLRRDRTGKHVRHARACPALERFIRESQAVGLGFRQTARSQATLWHSSTVLEINTNSCIAVTYKTLSKNSVVFETRKPTGAPPGTIHGPNSIVPCTLISTQLVYLHS